MRIRDDEIIGYNYEMLTVLDFSHKTGGGGNGRSRKHYVCGCECGRTTVLRISVIRQKKTKSCGCLPVGNPRNPDIVGALTDLLFYKYRSQSRGRQFALTREQFVSLINGACHYCGVVGDNRITSETYYEGMSYNGIDRVDNNVGYVIENVVSCCGRCNIAKGSMPAAAFIEMARRIAARHGVSRC